MPQATDLTLKNGASTPVDKLFKLISPAAGFGALAEWALKEGSISAVFPRITAMVREAQKKAGRSSSKISQHRIRVPSSYLDTVTGQTMVNSAFEANITITVPDDYPEASKADAVAFTKNYVNHALFADMVKDGAPAS